MSPSERGPPARSGRSSSSRGRGGASGEATNSPPDRAGANSQRTLDGHKVRCVYAAFLPKVVVTARSARGSVASRSRSSRRRRRLYGVLKGRWALDSPAFSGDRSPGGSAWPRRGAGGIGDGALVGGGHTGRGPGPGADDGVPHRPGGGGLP